MRDANGGELHYQRSSPHLPAKQGIFRPRTDDATKSSFGGRRDGNADEGMQADKDLFYSFDDDIGNGGNKIDLFSDVSFGLMNCDGASDLDNKDTGGGGEEGEEEEGEKE
jgi:hypothetical protein